MTETTFVAKNDESWKALEAFNTRLHSLRGGIKMLTAEEIREFARLFRLASFHLAYAKTHYPAGNTVAYLNNLAGVSHNFFYVRESGSFGVIKEYFLYTLPQTVRETYKYWVLATAFFVFGMFFAGFYVAGDTTRLADIMPEGFGHFAPGEVPEFAFGEGSDATVDGSLMSAFFITNNTTVAFNAFAWGFLAGIGSLFILFYNGLVVGGLFGFFHTEGANMLAAYSLVLPHGVLELAAIFLSGGGGLMIGKGILMPGEHTRAHSLVLHAKKAVKLIPAIVIMLVMAAFIEGFFTPLPINPWIKLAFAAITGIMMIAYFLKPTKK